MCKRVLGNISRNIRFEKISAVLSFEKEGKITSGEGSSDVRFASCEGMRESMIEPWSNGQCTNGVNPGFQSALDRFDGVTPWNSINYET